MAAATGPKVSLRGGTASLCSCPWCLSGFCRPVVCVPPGASPVCQEHVGTPERCLYTRFVTLFDLKTASGRLASSEHRETREEWTQSWWP